MALVAGTGPMERLEQRTIDTRMHIRGDHPTDELVVIAIDDDAFSAPRRSWPLRRALHARAIDRLREAGVRQIVYDVQFTEPSNRPDDDLALFDAVARAKGTVLATAESDAAGRTRVLGGDRQLARIGAEAGAAELQAEPGGIDPALRAQRRPARHARRPSSRDAWVSRFRPTASTTAGR